MNASNRKLRKEYADVPFESPQEDEIGHYLKGSSRSLKELTRKGRQLQAFSDVRIPELKRKIAQLKAFQAASRIQCSWKTYKTRFSTKTDLFFKVLQDCEALVNFDFPTSLTKPFIDNYVFKISHLKSRLHVLLNTYNLSNESTILHPCSGRFCVFEPRISTINTSVKLLISKCNELIDGSNTKIDAAIKHHNAFIYASRVQRSWKLSQKRSFVTSQRLKTTQITAIKIQHA